MLTAAGQHGWQIMNRLNMNFEAEPAGWQDGNVPEAEPTNQQCCLMTRDGSAHILAHLGWPEAACFLQPHANLIQMSLKLKFQKVLP